MEHYRDNDGLLFQTKDGTLRYQKKTNKKFWYCASCHEANPSAMFTKVKVKCSSKDQCKKCHTALSASSTKMVMIVYEEFDFDANPPPFQYHCVWCDEKYGKYWTGCQEIWYDCRNSECTASYCKDCWIEISDLFYCSLCDQSLVTSEEEEEPDATTFEDFAFMYDGDL